MTSSSSGHWKAGIAGRRPCSKSLVRAKYAADLNVPDLAYGVAVASEIAKGRIKSIDRSAALAVPGVIEVFAHDNRPERRLFDARNIRTRRPRPARPSARSTTIRSSLPGSPSRWWWRRSSRSPLRRDLVAIEYEAAQAVTDIDREIKKAYEPKVRANGWA